MTRSSVSAAARCDCAGGPACSSSSASLARTRLSAASGSVVKRQTRRRMAGAGCQAESASSVTVVPRSQLRHAIWLRCRRGAQWRCRWPRNAGGTRRTRCAPAGCARARWRRTAARESSRGSGPAPWRSRPPRRVTPCERGCRRRLQRGIGVGGEGEDDVACRDRHAVVPERAGPEMEAPGQRIHPLPGNCRGRTKRRRVDGGAAGLEGRQPFVDTVADVATDRLEHQRAERCSPARARRRCAQCRTR